MNLPNKLTLIRFLLVPVFVAFVETSYMVTGNENFKYNMLAALIVFAVASFTDFLDGYLARKNNIVTDFGKFMDPLADKVLTTAAIIYLVRFGLCSSIVLVLILTREFAVSGIRMVAASSADGGKVIAASVWGKVKTVIQMIVVIVSFLFLTLIDLRVEILVDIYEFCIIFINVGMWLVAITTIISGINYILPNIDLIRDAE